MLQQVVSHVQNLLVAYLKGIINGGLFKVGSRPIQPHSFNHCIKRVFQAVPLFLLTREQNSILDFVKQPRSLWISKDDLYLAISSLQILRNSSYSPPSASSANEAVNHPSSLAVYLRPRGLLVNLSIFWVFELIGEVSSLLPGINLSPVEEMLAINY